MQYENKQILILGMGKSGQAMARFFHRRGAHIAAYDDVQTGNFEDICPIYNSLGDICFNNLDLIASSPGIPIDHPIYIQARQANISVLGEMQIGLSALSNTTLGITGTNGKSTLVSLVAHVLNENQILARAAGNIGVPITAIVDDVDPDEILVVELSSYQIDTLNAPSLDWGLVLNISPDHLKRYHTMSNYARSKLMLARWVRKPHQFFTSQKIVHDWSEHLSSTSHQFFDQTPPKGDFHDENLLAAYTLTQALGLSKEQIMRSLKTFKGLPHRLEYVCSWKGIDFYNDSKGSNVEAVMRAVDHLSKPIYLIMGGDDKGLDYSPLKAYFLDKVKEIFIIGPAQETMAKVFEKDYTVLLYNTLKEAAHAAFVRCSSPGAVLLSPGTSSFSMFRNFEHRGDEFKRIVKQLAGERE